MHTTQANASAAHWHAAPGSQSDPHIALPGPCRWPGQPAGLPSSPKAPTCLLYRGGTPLAWGWQALKHWQAMGPALRARHTFLPPGTLKRALRSKEAWEELLPPGVRPPGCDRVTQVTMSKLSGSHAVTGWTGLECMPCVLVLQCSASVLVRCQCYAMQWLVERKKWRTSLSPKAMGPRAIAGGECAV
jgi:hypothetical protein